MRMSKKSLEICQQVLAMTDLQRDKYISQLSEDAKDYLLTILDKIDDEALERFIR